MSRERFIDFMEAILVAIGPTIVGHLLKQHESSSSEDESEEEVEESDSNSESFAYVKRQK